MIGRTQLGETIPDALPDTFLEDLAFAKEKACRYAEVYEVYGYLNGDPVRRVYMPRAKQHLYYLVEGDDAVLGLYVWGALVEQGPPIERKK